MKFTKYNLTGLALCFIGLLYSAISLIYIEQNNNGAFTCAWVGIPLIALGILLISIDSMNQQTPSKIRISSHMLLFYKYFTPFFHVTIIVYLITEFFTLNDFPEILILLILALGILFAFLTSKFLKLRFIQFDSETLFVSNYWKTEEYDLVKIDKIESYINSLYSITIEGKKHKVITYPIFFEAFTSFNIGKPKSILRLENYIERRKGSNHTS